MNIFWPKLNYLSRVAFLSIILVESTSFLGYLAPTWNLIGFWALVLLAIYLTAKKLELGLAMLWLELLIGSKGYLFYGFVGGHKISIRIALWLAVMSIWFITFCYRYYKTKQNPIQFNFKENKHVYWALLGFSLFLAWGVINGFLRHTPVANIISDANAWVYGLLFFPLLSITWNRITWQNIFSLFWVGTSWLALKTLGLFFIFSHEQYVLVYLLYRWVRTTGVGEITAMQVGFYRVFIQSQWYNLIAYFWLIILIPRPYFNTKIACFKDKYFWAWLGLAGLNFSVILISLSRSFWIGLLVGLVFLFGYIIIPKFYHRSSISIKPFIHKLILSVMAGVLMVIVAITFPYPKPLAGLDAAKLFRDRVSDSNEVALGSRWLLLPKLTNAIKQNPIAGQGFGQAITYTSLDPRIATSNSGRQYTTFAFEWGWLDLWLKIGLIGLLFFITTYYLMVKKLIIVFKNEANLALTLILPAILLVAVHMFTPYINHPLGIGLLLLILIAAIQPQSLLSKND
ncbi:MAG: O-antigen ligase family protein [Candidatus Falkowbacteria bacterium]